MADDPTPPDSGGDGSGDRGGDGGGDERGGGLATLREEVHELKETLVGLIGGGKLDVEDTEGKDKAGGDKAKSGGTKTLRAEEEEAADFVRGIVKDLHDDERHKAEHERIAQATKPVEEAPQVVRAVTRFMWG